MERKKRIAGRKVTAAAPVSASAADSGKRKRTAEKAGDVKKSIKKRARQVRHLRILLQAAIRILNALDHKTIYRN